MKLFTTIVAANIVVAWFTTSRSRASQISLPNLGSNINYDYAVGTPQFVVSGNVADEALIHSEVTFADNKHLFVEI